MSLVRLLELLAALWMAQMRLASFSGAISAPEPPVPTPEQRAVQREAQHLLKHMETGRLTLTVPDREAVQLRSLAQDGSYRWAAPPSEIELTVRGKSEDDGGEQVASAPTSDGEAVPTARQLASRSTPGRGHAAQSMPLMPQTTSVATAAADVTAAPGLLRMLSVLAERASPTRPLELMSLLRPIYRTGGFVHVGPHNPHSLGLAADIAAYDGHTIRQDDPEGCVAATLAVLRALPPGRYRLGMPKAPETPLLVGRPPLPLTLAGWLPSAPRTLDGAAAADCVMAALLGATLDAPTPPPWPFFPAPEPELDATTGRVVPVRRGGQPTASGAADLLLSNALPAIARYRNESYAPLSDLQDERVRAAIAAAARRGVEIIAAFPDGADHLHVDVRHQP